MCEKCGAKHNRIFGPLIKAMNDNPKNIFPLKRRNFLKLTASATAGYVLNPGLGWEKKELEMNNTKIRIKRVDSNFEREPLFPYRFKGGAITECWQTVAMLENDAGVRKIGLGTQGVLWSDSRVAFGHSETGGHSLMFNVSEFALKLIEGQSFTDPVQLLEGIYPEVYAYASKITNLPDLRKTFALNALVCVDNAAWLLYAHEHGIDNFDEMVPDAYKQGLSARHDKVASIPSFATGTSIDELTEATDEGYFILKLKIGAAGTQEEMLEKDKQFLTAVHRAMQRYSTPYTTDGKIPYYFDANGRYEKKETLERLLDHARQIGAFDQIAVVEEPFDESNEEFVGDLGVRIASDESAHTVEDAAERIEMGYTAFAVKGIAKTLSMTMKIAQLAYEHDVPCFCADLTVNPILVEWNKNVAARLPSFPGISVGLQEANGHQYYKNWDEMLSYHPMPEAPWVEPDKGVYHTEAPFYEHGGGIFAPLPHYEKLFEF